MPIPPLLSLRLSNQLLCEPSLHQPEDVVSWMGAIQAQDYAAAKWAIGLRLAGANDAIVEQAFNEGRILRTHVLRPTWHFVSPSDIRWMLELTAPRVHLKNGTYYRRLGVDSTAFRRSESAMRKALRGGVQMTRAGLTAVLQKAGLHTEELLLNLLLMHAELEGVICSGPRRGKQFTYMLLEERAPGAKSLPREAALRELAGRYFRSHGPATPADFAWWSGLTLADARQAIERLHDELISETWDGKEYWFSSVVTGGEVNPRISAQSALSACSPRAYLLPNFDEYIVAYTDRDAFYDPSHDAGLIPRNSMLANHTLLVDGRVAGTWRRTLQKGSVLVALAPFEPLKKAEERLVREAAQRFAAFLGLQLVLA